MRMSKPLLSALSAAAVIGCSDPNAPTDENFGAAISVYLAMRPACITTPAFPADIEKPAADARGIGAEIAASRYTRHTERLDVLVDAGLLSASDASAEKKTMTMLGHDPEVETVAVRRYTLTDAGRQQASDDGEEEQSFFKSDETLFCYGERVLEGVDNFSEPTSLMGMKVSKVDYRYSVRVTEEWAKGDPVSEAFPSIRDDLASATQPERERDILVLTDQGWIHQDLYRQ